MAFSTPSYATIRDRMLADVDASLAASGSTRGVVEYAIVSAVSVAALLLHVTIARIARNSVPSKAEAWLMRLWAAFFGITPKSATQHTGTATFVADTGASIPAGTSLRLRNGTEFTTDAEGNESGGTIAVAFTATAYGPAGRSLPASRSSSAPRSPASPPRARRARSSAAQMQSRTRRSSRGFSTAYATHRRAAPKPTMSDGSRQPRGSPSKTCGSTTRPPG